MLHVSVSSLEDFMTCRRLYFYKRIRKYEKIEFDIPFLVGRVIHMGIANVLKKKNNAIKLMRDYFRKEKAEINKALVLTPEQEEDLNEQEFITQGMLKAYMRRYEKMLRETTLLENEVEGSLQIGECVTFVIKLDNLLRVRNKKVLHELKSSKYITPDYVRSIQTDIQTAAYFYIYNTIYKKRPINEIMYDIIRKPSIRQKKGESYQGYLKRLEEWYQKPDDMSVFHIERFQRPKINEGDLWNTIEKVSSEMLQCKSKEDYYQDFEKCHGYYGKRCPYYELCHEGGETKENLVLYQIRKSYHINK